MAKPPTPLTLATANHIKTLLGAPPSAGQLHQVLRYLAKWRAEMLLNTVIRRSGQTVLSGPFAGMIYRTRGAEGSAVARLIGAYEASLAPVIEAIIAAKPQVIIDLGSAEGYYAVGLARRLPQTRVLARDADPKARALCRQLAQDNGVASRVEVGGIFGHADFEICQTARSVVICDIEGAEAALLDPVAAPGLLCADILVEVHETMDKGLTDRLSARFAATHKITRLGRVLEGSGLPDWMEEFSDLDRLLTLWEWREGPTPWLWMEKR